MSRHKSFQEQLKHLIRDLNHLKKGDVHVISVHSRHGHYQIMISEKNNSSDNMHPAIQINGELYHLIISPKHDISLMPDDYQINDNLKDTLIVKQLTINMTDMDGSGCHVDTDSDLHAKDYVNLAGREGELFLDNMDHDTHFLHQTYALIQADILESLTKKRKLNAH